ncbi:MAG: transcriptional repressor [Phycisphaerae bacterium]|nr:transcriptional repressor [Phycisphaerae bacterium]
MERRTRQKDAITRTLGRAGKPLLPREILTAARRRCTKLGIATVYRGLRAMLGAGVVTCVRIPGAPPRYELSGTGHHHYFRCRSCRRVFNVQGCPGGFRALVPRGFRLEAHDLVLYGRCAACRDLART